MIKAIQTQKDGALKQKQEQAQFYKHQDILLKKVARKLRTDPRIGSKGFSQCLRTCASSEAFVSAMAAEPVENPESTFTTTVTVNIDVNEYIAEAGEEDEGSRGAFSDNLTVPQSLLGVCPHIGSVLVIFPGSGGEARSMLS